MSLRRVVITGMGAISAAGNGTNMLWQTLLAGKSGITRSADGTPAGTVTLPDTGFLTPKEKRRMARFQLLAVIAAGEALKEAQITLQTPIDRDRFGVIAGSAAGGLDVYDRNLQALDRQGADAVSALFIPTYIHNSLSGTLAIRYGARGVNFTPVSACASGTHAIGEAYKAIACDQADIVLSGGSDACITPAISAGFQALTALSSRDCRPFDRDRDGFVLGEGAGMMVLEELFCAKRRGAKILAEVSGYGATCDAHHITAPLPDGSGSARAMLAALSAAGVTPEEIGYLCAHGTGTRLNDLYEARAVQQAFGSAAAALPVSSIKGVTGHAIGGSGALESIVCVMAIRENTVPPTVNCPEPDPECGINIIRQPLRKNIRCALNNSLGFGGHNAALIFKRYKEI